MMSVKVEVQTEPLLKALISVNLDNQRLWSGSSFTLCNALLNVAVSTLIDGFAKTEVLQTN